MKPSRDSGVSETMSSVSSQMVSSKVLPASNSHQMSTVPVSSSATVTLSMTMSSGSTVAS